VVRSSTDVADVTELDVRLDDGRVVHAFDSGPIDAEDEGLAIVWHHGSPQTGAILDPLLEQGAKRGLRFVSCARASYGGSSPNPGRSIASVAAEIRVVVDALGIERFATIGASGGGPHALACAALLPDRVVGVVTFASPAPFRSAPEWFAGMAAPGALQAATEGRHARLRFAETDDFDERQFIARDWAALEGSWRSLGQDAGRAGAAGPDGLVDDDVALVNPWGFDPAGISAPVLLVQGGADRVIPAGHAQWLLEVIPTAELWLRPRDGHVSVLEAMSVAIDWLLHRSSSDAPSPSPIP
jgi:pimeloyl-ACP methyl ester carboxylesterase